MRTHHDELCACKQGRRISACPTLSILTLACRHKGNRCEVDFVHLPEPWCLIWCSKRKSSRGPMLTSRVLFWGTPVIVVFLLVSLKTTNRRGTPPKLISAHNTIKWATLRLLVLPELGVRECVGQIILNLNSRNPHRSYFLGGFAKTRKAAFTCHQGLPKKPSKVGKVTWNQNGGNPNRESVMDFGDPCAGNARFRWVPH